MFVYFLLFIPAIIANGSPPIFAKLFPDFLNFPVDFNKEFRKKRILGDHKTFRGFLLGTLLAQIVFFFIYPEVSNLVSIYFGALSGFLVLLFDSIKSFFKRQIGISSGKPWFPFDQIDWIFGFLISLYVYINPGLFISLLYLIFGLLIHLISKVLGYLLKINDSFV